MRSCSRRGFLTGLAAFGLAGCGRGSTRTEHIDLSRLDPPIDYVLGGDRPKYVEKARAWLVPIPKAALSRAEALLPFSLHDGIRAGLLAVSDICPNDKVQLVFCPTSLWFECPGCGSKFNAFGDFKAGPAPAGMSLVPLDIGRDGTVAASTRAPLSGLARGVHLINQDAAGPHCA